jgi:two-component system response regulator LytT
MNVVIIEDEVKAALELKRQVESIENSNAWVSCILQSIDEAIEWFNANPTPDLILSDIQLADGLCFDIFRQIKMKCPVIFCTAYDQYALQAFDNNAIDYLLKPIDSFKLKQSFDKMERLKAIFNNQSDLNDKLNHVMLQMYRQYDKALMVYIRDRIIPISTQEVDFILKDAEGTFLFSKKQKYEKRNTLDNIIMKLDPKYFIRANRQCILHRDAISHMQQGSGRKLIVSLFDYDTEVIISKANANAFVRWLELI